MTHQNKTDKTWSSPYKTRNQKVLPEWIDYNGHMNVAYYTLAFDKALDFFSGLSYLHNQVKFIEKLPLRLNHTRTYPPLSYSPQLT